MHLGPNIEDLKCFTMIRMKIDTYLWCFNSTENIEKLEMIWTHLASTCVCVVHLLSKPPFICNSAVCL